MENTFKGTKGKWSVSQPNGKSIIAEADNALGYEVIVVQDAFMNKYENKAKANALLASKAPELLEFVQFVAKSMPDGSSLQVKALKLIKSATEL